MFAKIVPCMFVSVFLTACAAPTATPVFIPTQTITPTPPAIAATETLAPTTEPTAAPYDAEAETAKQKAIVENATSRNVDFAYLNSPEYLEELKQKDARGELPNVSPNAVFVTPGSLKIMEMADNETFAKKYGFYPAYKYKASRQWYNAEKQPWKLVDEGVTKVGELTVSFRVFKWQNNDGSAAYIGYLTGNNGEAFDTSTMRTHAFLDVAYNFVSYPNMQLFDPNNGCARVFQIFYPNSVSKSAEFCKIVTDNSNSFTQNILDWNTTGILKNTGDTVTWLSASGYRIE